MTGQDIYILASAILWEGDNEDQDSKKFSVQFLNHLLPEALNAENSLRRRAGMEVLQAAPVIRSLDEEIPYREKLCRTALVYGLCWHFFENLQNNYQSELHRTLFASSLEELNVGQWESLVEL